MPKENEKIVLPGEFLSTEEEFSAGANTYEQNGNIYADSAGSARFDGREKTVGIERMKKVCILKRDSIVYGRVNQVKENFVHVDLLSAEDNELTHTVISQSSASLPIRNVSKSYVKTLKENFKIGDIVRAAVANASPLGIDLRTDENDLGVVKAFCSNCRNLLLHFGQNLKCTACGATESRKIAANHYVQ